MKRYLGLGIVLGASILGLWLYMHAWTAAPALTPDSPAYMTVARDLSRGGLPEARVRTPGYPFLLLLTGASDEPTRSLFVVQLLLQVLSVLLMCVTLRSVGVSNTVAVAAGLIGLLPPFVETTAYVLTESLAQFCIVLGVVCLQRFLDRRNLAWLLSASLAFGYAAFTRPTFELAAVMLGVLLVLWARKTGALAFGVRDAVLLFCGTLLLSGGWWAYNEARLGVSGTTAALGFNLTTRLPDLYEGIPDPVTRRLLIEARNEAYVTGRPVPWAHFEVEARLMNELGITRKADLEPWLRRQMLLTIVGHPVQYLQIVAGSFARFWLPATGRLPLLRERHLRVVWYAISLLLVALVAAEAFAFGTWICVTVAGIRTDEQTRRAWTLWGICAALILYNALISCMIESGETRYRAPTEVLLLLAAGTGVLASGGLFRALAALARKVAPRTQAG